MPVRAPDATGDKRDDVGFHAMVSLSTFVGQEIRFSGSRWSAGREKTSSTRILIRRREYARATFASSGRDECE